MLIMHSKKTDIVYMYDLAMSTHVHVHVCTVTCMSGIGNEDNHVPGRHKHQPETVECYFLQSSFSPETHVHVHVTISNITCILF